MSSGKPLQIHRIHGSWYIYLHLDQIWKMLGKYTIPYMYRCRLIYIYQCRLIFMVYQMIWLIFYGKLVGKGCQSRGSYRLVKVGWLCQRLAPGDTPWKIKGWNMIPWRFGRSCSFLNCWLVDSMLIFQGIGFRPTLSKNQVTAGGSEIPFPTTWDV